MPLPLFAIAALLVAEFAAAQAPKPEGPSAAVQTLLPLSDGRAVPVWADRLGTTAARVFPRGASGAYGDFGVPFDSGLVASCPSGALTLDDDGFLTCGGQRPRVSPNVTLPSDPSAFETSPVPPVKPGPRAVGSITRPRLPALAASLVGAAVLAVIALVLARLRPSAPQLHDVAPRGPTRGAWLTLAPLIAVGAALRLWNLGLEPLEQNEFTYVMTAFGHESWLDVLLDVNAMAQTHAPLPHLLQFALSPLGTAEWVTRLPMALAGTLTLPVLFSLAWRLGNRVFGDGHAPAVALIATALLALSPVHVWYSRDASPYALVTLFAALALLGAERATRGRGGRALMAVASVLGFYTHYYSLHLTLVLYALVLIGDVRRSGLRAMLPTFASGLAAAAALLPWLPAFLAAYQWSEGHSTAYQRDAGVYHPSASVITDGLDVVRLLLGLGLPGAFAVGAAVATVLGAALLRVCRQDRSRVAALNLLVAPLAWFTAFELVNRETFLKSLYGGYYFGIRYGLFLFPAAVLLVALAVRSLPSGRAGRAVSAVVLAFLLGDAARQSGAMLFTVAKPDVASAAALVTRHARDGDAILVGPAVFYQHPWHYYAAPPERRDAQRAGDWMRTPDWDGSGVLGVLTDLVEPWSRSLSSAFVKRVWVIDHMQHLFGRREFSDRPAAAIDAALAGAPGGLTEVWRRDFHDVRVRLFERTTLTLAPLPTAPDGRPGLHIGWNDGPFTRGTDPSAAWTRPGRRVRARTELNVPVPKDATTVTLRVGAVLVGPPPLSSTGPATPVTFKVTLNGRTAGSWTVNADFEDIEVPLTPGDRGTLHLRFELGTRPAGLLPSDLMLDQLVFGGSPTTRG